MILQMIRILILLVTLNAIFPAAGIASICAPNKTESLMSTTNNVSDTHHQNTSVSTQKHCNHPGMSGSCDMEGMDNIAETTQTYDCDSSCCTSCLGISAILDYTHNVSVSHSLSMIPIPGYITFHTRFISPELRPPLA